MVDTVVEKDGKEVPKADRKLRPLKPGEAYVQVRVAGKTKVVIRPKGKKK